MSLKDFVFEYIDNLKNLLDGIDYNVISDIIKLLETTKINQSKIYVIGNGGSASTASHMVNDLGAGLRRRDIINLDIVSLADNTPVCTAIANDIGYDNIFYMQLKGLLKKDDVIIAISCSGNSANIIKAVDYAKEIGSKIIGVTGFDGGYLKKISDVNFHVQTKSNEYGLVEDMHMILDHIIYSYYIKSYNKSE
ncbi:SIS domain-containing protein [Arcobacter sp. FWKO B]|uniref:SIS domain-containing protein n=1 Tax=Arcobacter sp. FWKO B TaxID=2593672 RepID=UPI0018A59740|nr:SIS domain-containing protein [Arcobacter sp. FWKO B]QOG12179.1 SIS domain-containing protein [Arcobacter sp. FWKO B]